MVVFERRDRVARRGKNASNWHRNRISAPEKRVAFILRIMSGGSSNRNKTMTFSVSGVCVWFGECRLLKEKNSQESVISEFELIWTAENVVAHRNWRFGLTNAKEKKTQPSNPISSREFIDKVLRLIGTDCQSEVHRNGFFFFVVAADWKLHQSIVYAVASWLWRFHVFGHLPSMGSVARERTCDKALVQSIYGLHSEKWLIFNVDNKNNCCWYCNIQCSP